jgi:hypothetical protein
MTDLLTHGLAFVLGWTACVLFIAAFELPHRLIDFAAEKLRDDAGGHKPCPWPCDDEAERDGLLAEFHPFHSTHVASGAQRNHGL